jgi:hypothetical protein
MPMRRVLLAGLIAMGVVALISAIWPGFAGVVSAVFATVLALALLAPTALVAWRLRATFAARRELGGMAPVEAPWAVGPEPDVPTLAQLRGTA